MQYLILPTLASVGIGLHCSSKTSAIEWLRGDDCENRLVEWAFSPSSPVKVEQRKLLWPILAEQLVAEAGQEFVEPVFEVDDKVDSRSGEPAAEACVAIEEDDEWRPRESWTLDDMLQSDVCRTNTADLTDGERGRVLKLMRHFFVKPKESPFKYYQGTGYVMARLRDLPHERDIFRIFSLVYGYFFPELVDHGTTWLKQVTRRLVRYVGTPCDNENLWAGMFVIIPQTLMTSFGDDLGPLGIDLLLATGKSGLFAIYVAIFETLRDAYFPPELEGKADDMDRMIMFLNFKGGAGRLPKTVIAENIHAIIQRAKEVYFAHGTDLELLPATELTFSETIAATIDESLYTPGSGLQDARPSRLRLWYGQAGPPQPVVDGVFGVKDMSEMEHAAETDLDPMYGLAKGLVMQPRDLVPSAEAADELLDRLLFKLIPPKICNTPECEMFEIASWNSILMVSRLHSSAPVSLFSLAIDVAFRFGVPGLHALGLAIDQHRSQEGFVQQAQVGIIVRSFGELYIANRIVFDRRFGGLVSSSTPRGIRNRLFIIEPLKRTIAPPSLVLGELSCFETVTWDHFNYRLGDKLDLLHRELDLIGYTPCSSNAMSYISDTGSVSVNHEWTSVLCAEAWEVTITCFITDNALTVQVQRHYGVGAQCMVDDKRKKAAACNELRDTYLAVKAGMAMVEAEMSRDAFGLQWETETSELGEPKNAVVSMRSWDSKNALNSLKIEAETDKCAEVYEATFSKDRLFVTQSAAMKIVEGRKGNAFIYPCHSVELGDAVVTRNVLGETKTTRANFFRGDIFLFPVTRLMIVSCHIYGGGKKSFGVRRFRIPRQAIKDGFALSHESLALECGAVAGFFQDITDRQLHEDETEARRREKERRKIEKELGKSGHAKKNSYTIFEINYMSMRTHF